MNSKCSCKDYCFYSGRKFDCSELTETSLGIVICEKEKAITNMLAFDGFLKNNVPKIDEFRCLKSEYLYDLENRVINDDNSVTREEHNFVESLRRFNSSYPLFTKSQNFGASYTLDTCKAAYDLFQAIETIIDYIENDCF